MKTICSLLIATAAITAPVASLAQDTSGSGTVCDYQYNLVCTEHADTSVTCVWVLVKETCREMQGYLAGLIAVLYFENEGRHHAFTHFLPLNFPVTVGVVFLKPIVWARNLINVTPIGSNSSS